MFPQDLRRQVDLLSAKYAFRHSFVLDQYFLVDAGVIERAVRYAELSPQDTVLEIGPGLGFITHYLARSAGRVVAIEKDERLKPLLQEELAQYKNVELVFADCLDASWPHFTKTVSAIPFSASAPITFKLLDHEFQRAVLFYQKEFGQKMLAQPGSPDYGRLSVMVQNYFNARIQEVVNRNSFYPQPKTDACIMTLEKKDVPRDPEFDVFVRELFRYPNKDVRNAVRHAFGKDAADERKLFTLTIEDLKNLREKISKQQSQG